MTTTTTAVMPHPDPDTTPPLNPIFSYLDIAGFIVGDWQIAHPEENRNAEEMADAILGSFSTERLHAVVLAHLRADQDPDEQRGEHWAVYPH
jgi:hypothetical protein